MLITTVDGRRKQIVVRRDGVLWRFLAPPPPAAQFSWNQETDEYLSGEPTPSPVHEAMRRCVLGLDGKVAYYLHPEDSRKKEDGSPAILTGADGNVMVEIPPVYSKITWDNGVLGIALSNRKGGLELDPAFCGIEEPIYVSAYLVSATYRSNQVVQSISGTRSLGNISLNNLRTYCRNNGVGYSTLDFSTWQLLWKLYLTEYGNWNSQETIGQGLLNYTTGTQGGSDSIGNASGSGGSSNSWASYRGIESLWGHKYQWCDGFNLYDSRVYINTNPETYQSGKLNGDYIDTGLNLVNSSGYIKSFHEDENWFVPNAVGGSDKTFVTDYVYGNYSGHRALGVGGHSGIGLAAGLACFYVYCSAANSYSDFGGRLVYRPGLAK